MTNPMESTFVTIRLRHSKAQADRTRPGHLTMIFKLAQSAAKNWSRLTGSQVISLVIQGRSFQDEILRDDVAASNRFPEHDD